MQISNTRKRQYGIGYAQSSEVKVLRATQRKGMRYPIVVLLLSTGRELVVEAQHVRDQTAREARRRKGSRLDRKRSRFGKSLYKKG